MPDTGRFVAEHISSLVKRPDKPLSQLDLAFVSSSLENDRKAVAFYWLANNRTAR